MGVVGIAETQRPVLLFLLWPLSPIFCNETLKEEMEKESFIHLLAARTADINCGNSFTEEKTHIGKKKAMSHFQIKKRHFYMFP